MTAETYTTLTDQDKLAIVTQHVRNKEYSLYSDEIDHMEESSSTVVNQTALDAITARMADTDAKLVTLRTEQTRLSTAISAAV